MGWGEELVVCGGQGESGHQSGEVLESKNTKEKRNFLE